MVAENAIELYCSGEIVINEPNAKKERVVVPHSQLVANSMTNKMLSVCR